MSTILGEHIDLVRPRKIPIPRKEKEAWKPRRDKVAKTREIGIAEFFRLCLTYDFSHVEKKRCVSER